MRIEEAAKVLGLTKRQVRARIANGSLVAVTRNTSGPKGGRPRLDIQIPPGMANAPVPSGPAIPVAPLGGDSLPTGNYDRLRMAKLAREIKALDLRFEEVRQRVLDEEWDGLMEELAWIMEPMKRCFDHLGLSDAQKERLAVAFHEVEKRCLTRGAPSASHPPRPS